MASLEWLDQFGNIKVDTISEADIATLDEPRQKSLLALVNAADVKSTAGTRMARARKRLQDAIGDEAVKAQAFKDSNAVIPFSVSKIEADLGRHLNAAEMAEARRQHGTACRELIADRERKAASASYVPQ